MASNIAKATYKPYGVEDHAEDTQTVERLLKERALAFENKNTTLFFARKFVGCPYVANTLEVVDPECLVVDTRRFDCLTLVEVVTALTLCYNAGECDYSAFLDVLASLRYRDGRVEDYTSRLHYFSEWIENNETKGWVRELNSPNPPFKAQQTLDLCFMSRNADKYIMLRKHPEFVPVIRDMEVMMKGRRCRYIPKSAVVDSPLMRKTINDGDIIAITCNKPGLDIAHLGFAVWRNDGLHLLNASMIHKKVVEENMTLGNYLGKHPTFTGIRVVRIGRN